MRPRCPFCQKISKRLIIQFARKPAVKVCGNCEKVLTVDEYDAWYASVSAFGHERERVWKHRKSREDYVREVEDELIMTSFVKLMLPRRNSV